MEDLETQRQGLTGCDDSQTSFMGIERVVNGHDRDPKSGHKEVNEEQGGEGTQGHESQHCRRARR